MAELALSAEREQHRQTEAKATAAEMELVNLQHRVVELEKTKEGVLKEMEMDILMKSRTRQPKLDEDVYPLRSQIVLQKRKIKTLERSIKVARDWAKKERIAKTKLEAKVRCGFHCLYSPLNVAQ